MSNSSKTHPAPAARACSEEHGHDHSVASHAHDHAGMAADDAGAYRVKDPVCGMMVDPHATEHRAEHDGHPYYFCSNGCRTKFVAEPVRYLDPGQSAAKSDPVPEGSIYTCPMHPEIRQVGPGA
jgi:P-type Cu+ transporter